ncbi:DMT family transporter [Herbiconiux sp. CPCC 203407]|uniref:DMT family transporter n=1 Tax=Herbiconiux oxytropis TaxID=2970915 RepID=A0AA41XGZ3_9MICO|nr:DMT family transporter [Herbiconiux oxytropis]MCS5723275.1 DMT family transporter [Herbiconiux oxytropis]MCS5727817.1 DMT family transporter [Herbiconiux oxytropis]
MTEPVTLTSLPLAGIALAVVAALLLSLGNELQSRGVGKVSAQGEATGLGLKQVKRLMRSRVWLLGTLSLGAAILVQLASLSLAPLIVVQPVGVTALVFAALLTAWATKRLPTKRVVRAILICIAGVGVFVAVAAVVSKQRPIRDEQLIAILIVLAVVLLAIAAVFVVSRVRKKPVHPILHVFAGGILAGFVASLGKTVILRVQSALSELGEEFRFDSGIVLTLLCLLGIIVGGGLSIYFVQLSHVESKPEVVVAGLTVIDPVVAVVLGIVILGEAAGAPLWSIFVFVLAGAVAIAGVFLLSRAQNKDDRLAAEASS